MHTLAHQRSVTAGATVLTPALQHKLLRPLYVRRYALRLIGAAGPWISSARSSINCTASSGVCSSRNTAPAGLITRSSSCLLPSYSNSSQRHQHGSVSRQRVIAAAKSRKTDAQPAGPPDSASLKKLSVAELRELSKELGLPSTGKKAELLERITQHMQQGDASRSSDTESVVQQQGNAADEDSSLQDVVGDITLEELIMELEAELANYSKAELVQCLQDRNMDTAGSKKDLVNRLAAAVAQEELRETLDEQQQQQLEVPPAPAAAPVSAPAAAAAASEVGKPAAGADGMNVEGQRAWAIADKQQEYYDQLLRENVKREELLQTLAELNQTASEDETIEQLVERVSWLLAEEEQEMVEQHMQQQELQQQAPQEPAQTPSSILDSISATDINKMKVDELKSYLRQLGLTDQGTRYELRDRLMIMYVVRRAATAGNMDHLLEHLSQMTLGELRLQLESRRLDLSGTKAALELRLAEALVIENVGPEAAAALGKPAQEEDDDGGYNPLLEDYDELLTAAVDPAVRVALICGATPVTPASHSSSSTAAKLQRAAEALATANTLIDELHTAPLDEDQAAAAAANDSSSSSKCGVSLEVFWADDQGVFYQLPRTAIAALAPGDVAVRVPALATATFADATALAQHLAKSGIDAALCTLPGGALAVSGQIAAACDAAGVPLAGRPAFENEQVAQLSHATSRSSPLFGRAAVLEQLQALGYNTLPTLHISMQELQGSEAELRSWLQDAERDVDDRVATAEGLDALNSADAAAQDDSEASSSSSSSSRGSASIRSWTSQRYEVAAAVSSPAADGEEQQQTQSPPQPSAVERVLSWCHSHGMDPDLQVFTVSGSEGGAPLGCSRGYPALIKELLATSESNPSLAGVLVEPLYRKLVRWEVTVVSSAEDGPVALLPAELEQYSVLEELHDADLALSEWQMLQDGMEDEQISATLEALSAPEPPQTLDTLKTPTLPEPMPYNTLKMHMPPRASNKVTQTIRHAAAKAVAQLGLESAGLVRVSGCLALKPDWQEQYTLPPEALQKMPDFDAGQLSRMAADAAEKQASEPNPLCDYVDEEMHMADLAAFDQAQRTRAEGNGEADVLIAAVDVNVPLASSSLAGLQALEVGITPGGVARHLINLALLRAGKDDLLLPPPQAPSTADSAQWAQITGANDSLPQIAEQLVNDAVKAREEDDNAVLAAASKQDRAVFAAQPAEEGVQEVLAALTTCWLTEEQLAQPVQEPEEWTPEFDARSQEEIHAERDAHRTEEDLAARALRDEALYMYGDQPITYDRWDSGDDWIHPTFIAQQAMSEGKPWPSVQEIREQVEQQKEAKLQAVLDRSYRQEDELPEVTEDEVLLGRVLGHDRYRGGVIETLQRRAKEQGSDARDIAATAAEAAAAAIAAVEQPDGQVGLARAQSAEVDAAADESWTTWPIPDEKDVVEEAIVRRPAPRVWLLVGGDGLQREQAFRSGANAAAKLQRCCDLQVDVFVMPPAGAGENDTGRRSTLLSRRTEWRALGVPEDLYPDSMTDEALIEMTPAEVPLLNRQVFVAGPQHLARHSIEEAAESAERAARLASHVYHASNVVQKQQRDCQYDTQMELDAHYVQGVAGAWGGVLPGVLPPAPRFMELREMLVEACACEATLLLLLDDSTVSSGELQQLLEEANVPFTGMTADFVFKCSNRLTIAKAIDEIAESLAAQTSYAEDAQAAEASNSPEAADAVGLVSVPRKVVKMEELIGFLDRPEQFEDAFLALLHEWDNVGSVILKPPTQSGGMGIIRIASAEDLALVADAFNTNAPRIAAGTLTHQPLPITLPLSRPELLVAEPYIETDVVSVGSNGEVQWAGESRWVEVAVGLLGELGTMVALQPTLLAHAADGSRVQFTPAPQHILPQAAVEAVQGFAVALADGLGLRSIAQVDGFVNVDSGELIVMDVKPLPDLTDGSPILQQALANDPPMLPYQLFRHLAQEAFTSAAEAVDDSSAAGAGAGSAYYSAPADGSGLGAEDFDLGVDQGLGADLFGQGDDTDEAGVEDEDMEGMAAGWSRQ